MVSLSETLRDGDARADAAPESDAEAGRVIEVVRPERQTLPVVFASPHSGTDYPASFVAASKLDAATLCTQLREPTAQTAMRNMKRILRAGGTALVIEKLENESDLLDLLDFQVDFGQGYLFGEPRLSKA